MLEKLDRLQILITSIFVGNPLTVLLSIIQVQHRCNCVDTKPVHMEMLHPEQRIADQEIFYLRLAVVKNLRTPVRVLTFSRIRIFINRCTVKIRKSVRVSWKMSRYPVQNNPDFIFV